MQFITVLINIQRLENLRIILTEIDKIMTDIFSWWNWEFHYPSFFSFALADLALDNMVANKQLAEENRDKVRETLLSRHRHQHEKRHRKTEEGGSKLHLPIIRSLADIGKKYSEPKNLSQNGTYILWRFLKCFKECISKIFNALHKALLNIIDF